MAFTVRIPIIGGAFYKTVTAAGSFKSKRSF